MSAFKVKEFRITMKRHLRDIQSFIRPWHCLVCSANYGGQLSIDRINSYALNNFQPANRDIIGSVAFPDTFITEKPPEYVLVMQSNKNFDNILPPDDEIDGIMTFNFD